MKQKLWVSSLSPLLCLGFINSVTAASIYQAAALFRSHQTVVSFRQRLNFTPRGIGVPGRRVSGASRGGNCLRGADKLVALVPKNIAVSTISAYPRLFFYVPPNTAQALELVVQDTNPRQAYRTSVRPNGQGGIVSLALAANSQRQALAPGRVYNWTFSVICDWRSPDENQIVDGGIQRVLPDASLNSRLQRATSSQRLFLYAQAGYWENTLATLADLRRSRPNDSELRSDWLDLLQSVGLQNLAGVRLLPCC